MVPERVISIDSGLKLSVGMLEMMLSGREEWRWIPTPEGVELPFRLDLGVLDRSALACFEGSCKRRTKDDLMSTRRHPGVVSGRRHRR